MLSPVEIENLINEINFILYNATVLAKIEEINLKFINGLKIMENKGKEINYKYYERINELSNLAQNNLNIPNSKDFSKAIAFLELSELMLHRGMKDTDLDCLIAGFYGLKPD